jgi:hypothetical protein
VATAQIRAVLGCSASSSATGFPLVVRSFSVGGVIPSKVSKRYRSRDVSPISARVRATTCMLPPRHTPHSTTAPGIWWSTMWRVARYRAYCFSCLVIEKGRAARRIGRATSS